MNKIPNEIANHEICKGCTHCVQDKEWDLENPEDGPFYCMEAHVKEYWQALHEREEMYRVHALIEHEYDVTVFDGVPLDTDEGDSGPGGLMPEQCIWRSPPGIMKWIDKPGKIMERVLILTKLKTRTETKVRESKKKVRYGIAGCICCGVTFALWIALMVALLQVYGVPVIDAITLFAGTIIVSFLTLPFLFVAISAILRERNLSRQNGTQKDVKPK